MTRNARAQQRGMTLIELMIVVVILSVLSLVAMSAYERYIYSARNAEAVQMLGAVRVAQETYFESFGQYCGSSTVAVWPTSVPFSVKLPWDTPPEGNAWRDLGLKTPGQVWFQYQLSAGAKNGSSSIFLDTTKPWFWARAVGDFDGNGAQSTFEITSQSDEVYSYNRNR